MIIGIDFDNTIVCYDNLFYEAAVEQKLIPSNVLSNKNGVRDYLRREGREDAWTELQGLVYGSYIKNAPEFPGVKDFFRDCRQRGISLYIISHKTRYPFIGDTRDLHAAAGKWLLSHGFYEPAYFELTKEQKLKRIAAVGCTHFVEDLPEFLEDPGFPDDVEKILFDPNDICPVSSIRKRITSWNDLKGVLEW